MSKSQARVDFTVAILAAAAFIVFVANRSRKSGETDILQPVARINITAPHMDACDNFHTGRGSLPYWGNPSADQLRGAY